MQSIDLSDDERAALGANRHSSRGQQKAKSIRQFGSWQRCRCVNRISLQRTPKGGNIAFKAPGNPGKIGLVSPQYGKNSWLRQTASQTSLYFALRSGGRMLIAF